jgi:hypothetical protein
MRVRSSVSNLPFGVSVLARVTSKAHQAHVSSLSCQAFACIRPVMRDDRGRHGLSSRFPVAFRLPAFASWAFLFPPRDCSFLAIGLPLTTKDVRGPRRDFHVPHERDTGGVGCPLYSGATVLTQPTKTHQLPLPLLNGQPCTPVLLLSSGAPSNEASSGVHSRSPIHPSPRL